MALGAWIFLSVVLFLVILNRPFRKFFFWAAGIATVCCGLFFGYVSIKDWRERRQQARQAAIHQKKQDDCNARLNANSPDAFQKLANIDLCLANPDITVDEAAAAQHQKNLDQVTFDPRAGYTLKHPEGAAAAPDTLPADFFAKRNASHSTTLEGTITKDAVIYAESLPSGPGGRVLDKIESGTHVRVIRLDSIYGNVQIRTQNGITGWISSDDVSY